MTDDSTCKSERSAADSSARMGMGATDKLGRVAASIGQLDAVEPQFQPVMDVPCGGVLPAVPALPAMGLLNNAGRYFQLPHGYYPLESIFLLPAFMLDFGQISTDQRKYPDCPILLLLLILLLILLKKIKSKSKSKKQEQE
ncbi:MAG: hypothetical protein GY862_31955, partial [Gammaproteobacteria bacterium]|nr:hypothetical protein [Gammaproteobacteria bacterium]